MLLPFYPVVIEMIKCLNGRAISVDRLGMNQVIDWFCMTNDPYRLHVTVSEVHEFF